MSTIHFIRHGQASFGSDNYDRLSELGCEQARILGDYFSRLGVSFDVAYSGSLVRQRDTAQIVLSRMTPGKHFPEFGILPEFNEYPSASVIQALGPTMVQEEPSMAEALRIVASDRKAFQRVLEGAMLRWVSGRYDRDGLETWRAFYSRVQSGVRKVMAESGREKKIAVFSSGGTISAVMHMVLGLSGETALRLAWQIRNTSVSVVKYNDERIGLASFNSLAHIESLGKPELLTYG